MTEESTAAQNLAAAGLALGSVAILSFVDNFVGAIAEEAGLWQFLAVRAVFCLPILVIGARVLRLRLRPVSLPHVFLRSLAVSLGLLIYFAALGVLPVAQAGAGLFSGPIWVLILTSLVFRRRVTPLQLAAILAGFGGVLMVLQPDPSNLTGLSLLPLAAGMFYAMGIMLTRYCCAGESAVTLAAGIFTMMGLESLIVLLLLPDGATAGFALQGWVTPSARFLSLTLMHAAAAVVAVSLIAQAYRTGTPHFVAVFEYAFLVFASLWGLLLWDQATDALAWGGIAVIIGAGIAMARSQRRRVLSRDG